MSERLFAMYDEENPWRHVGFPPETTFTKLATPERLSLGVFDDSLGEGSSWKVIQGSDLEILLNELRKGYTIEKKSVTEEEKNK